MVRVGWRLKKKVFAYNDICRGTSLASVGRNFTGGVMDTLKVSSDTLFVLLGAVMVLAMHSGFAFLELGTVRKKNQVNALVKILCDFAVSTLAYFFVGYAVAYGVDFFVGADKLAEKSGYDLV
jgi:Amt family ammonium transporter